MVISVAQIEAERQNPVEQVGFKYQITQIQHGELQAQTHVEEES